MCLFNREIQGMNCGHEECKNFYMLNKQLCMYGLNSTPTSNVLKPTTQNTLPKTSTPTSQSASQKSSNTFPTPLDLNVKRPRPLGESSKDPESASPTKALKTEANSNQPSKLPGGQADDKPEVLTPKATTEPTTAAIKIPESTPTTQFPQPSTPASNTGEKNLLNNFILNNLLLPNPQGVSGPKSDTSSLSKITNPNLLLSLLNPTSGFNVPGQMQPKTPSQQSGMSSLGFPGLFPPNLGGMKPGPGPGPMNSMGVPGLPGTEGMDSSTSPTNIGMNSMNVTNLLNDIKAKSENGGLTGDGFLKEFQGRILGLLFTQNKMLMDLKEKNDVLQDTLACLINEINTIKNTTKQVSKDKQAISGGNIAPHQFMGSNTETVSVEDLVTFLYGPSPDFQYQIILKSDLPLPLYRERNFKFTVVLTDKNGNTVENSNRIPLTIGLYSSENPPKYIDANTAGNKILKGFIEKDLISGTATFEKIQIKEVTSHFRNGWIFFVVYPKITNTGGSGNLMMGGSSNAINSQKIKPLILEKVVVKAKKAKEKEATGEAGEAEDAGSTHNDEEKNEESSKAE